MKTIRTLFLATFAFLLGLSFAEAAVSVTVTVTTSSTNSNLTSAQLSVRDYQRSIIPVNGGTTASPGTISPSNYSYQSNITLTYSFTLPDNIRGQAISIGYSASGYVSNGSGGYTQTQTGYYTPLFTAQASVSLPMDGFNKGLNVTAPTGPQYLPPPQTGDLTIRNYFGDNHADLYLQFDTYSGTNIATTDTYGLGLDRISGGVPTLSQQYLGPGSRCRWSWSVGNTTTTRQIMAIDSADNILSLYNPASSTVPAIKLDPGTGTGTASTAKITIGTHTVLTDDVAAGLYLTQTLADGRYLCPAPNGSFKANPSNVAIGAYATELGNSATYADFATASGDSRVFGTYATAMGSSWADGSWGTALGRSYTNGTDATAIGDSMATGSGATAAGVSQARGAYATALGISFAYGDYSTAIGRYSKTWGAGSTAMGWSAMAQGVSQFVIGQFNLPQFTAPSPGIPSIPLGTNWTSAPTDELFTVGNGSDDTHRSNAFVVRRNGETTINGSLTVVRKPGDTAVTGNLTAQGTAHVVGAATFDGPVRFSKQGDIDMGVFVSVAP